MTISEKNLVWLDLEMTGLDPIQNRIIEMATIITDSNLNIVAEGPVFAINQSLEHLATMDEWNTKHHNQSGLVERVKISTMHEAEAEQLTIQFLEQYVLPGRSPLCGNSIYQDRRFLVNYMPKLEKFFHYRNLDVSTLKELAARWAPHVFEKVKKESTHLALADIKESIEELRFYRDNFLRV